jgi:hypothetical protein
MFNKKIKEYIEEEEEEEGSKSQLTALLAL